VVILSPFCALAVPSRPTAAVRALRNSQLVVSGHRRRYEQHGSYRSSVGNKLCSLIVPTPSTVNNTGELMPSILTSVSSVKVLDHIAGTSGLTLAPAGSGGHQDVVAIVFPRS